MSKMNFKLQLKLLLWKNYILRKRHLFRLFTEILWPLILFLILVAVRTKGLRKFQHECHFEEKVMPSAGFLPYAQSVLCSFNNTCHKTEQQGFTSYKDYDGALLTKLLEDLQEAISNNMNANRSETLARLGSDFTTMRNMWINFQRADNSLQGKNWCFVLAHERLT